MKYAVYGLGNALVDQEFEVTDEFLAKNDIEKGLMTLIDEARQHELVANLQHSFGLKKRTGGGSGANSIVAISQFGGKTFYACKVAQDEAGEFYASDLAKAGVKTRVNELNAQGVTGKCLVMVTDDAERTMNTFLGITSDLSEHDLFLDELKSAEYLYIEGYLVTSDVSRNAVMKARQVARDNNIKIAMTFSDPSMAKYFQAGLQEMIGDGLDLLFCNEEELLTFTKAPDLITAVQNLHPLVKKMVITRGEKGAVVVNGDHHLEIAAVPAKAIDTNGAGDIFAGAFLYGITHGLSDEQAGRLASLSASKMVSIYGARLSTAEHQEILKRVV
ncbi:adenosine kinase [Thiofilum flexile]|uniref:adenosine kinase n=1 Tax=Thiofilum flexile TaxID=125627 RepID=UPI0003637CA8|nr:adenosine kinase [Thiofilum flexile]